MLGHRGVLSPVLGGGRRLDERETRVAWGDGERPALRRELPWPGSLPPPLPAEVFREPRAVRVAGPHGEPVAVDDRGLLSAPPAILDGRDVVAWAGPWSVLERSWDEERARRAHRFQLVDQAQTAWLVVLEDGVWRAEGRYS
jgi:protein ImuB